MPIREQYEMSGGWLFRWRSFLPLLIIPILCLALSDSQQLEETFGRKSELCFEIASICIAFLGLLIRILIVGFTPRGTSGRNTKSQKAEVLNTTGMYSIVRHPLYVGNFFIFLGVILFTKVWWFVLLGILLYWLYYERIIFAEEAFLRGKFGDVFIEWAERTPTIVPDFSKWVSPALTFSPRNVLKREFNGFFGIIASLTAIRLLENAVIDKRFYLSQRWIWFLSTGFAIYVVLWFFKKFTKLLKVDGR